MRRKNQKLLAFFLAIPLILGLIVGFLSRPTASYEALVKPFFAPPGFVFPIVWTILYLLMGISSYLIAQSNNPRRYPALITYVEQLFVNLAWSPIFFTLNFRFLAFLWILFLIYLVVKMIVQFKRVSHRAAYLQIPYLLWLIFAALLNFSIVILNL
jgi:tspO and MBR like protein